MEILKLSKPSFWTTVLFVVLFLSLGTTTARAEVTYVGEICATAFPTPCTLVPCLGHIDIKLGVLSYGDGHYILNGTADSSPVYGTIQDNIATISLSTTSLNYAAAINIMLDLTTWTGTYSEMPIFPVLTPPVTSGSPLSLIAGVCQ